ncbi:MAG: OmpA family protein [Bacteroidota bacterium]
MKLNYLVFLALIFNSCYLFGQTDAKQFRKKFDQADVLLNIDNIPEAIIAFKELWLQDSVNANLNYKLGMCYYKTKLEKNKAVPYFEKAILNLTNNYIEFESTEKAAPYNTLYLLAKSHHHNNQFNEAIEDYTSYLKYLTENDGDKKEIKIIEREIERCKYGAEAIKKPTRIKVENLGENINSIYPDYAPLISADESVLIFTTRRKSMYNGNDGMDERTKFNDDIYISYKEGGEWQEAKPLNSFINTKENDATVGLSADGQQLFLYKEGDIYVSKLDGENWTQAIKLNENINTKYFEPSATISSDGNTLYFVSDRKGGFGGRDIYKCVKLPNGDWSKAQNLGPNINTEVDDEGPFISFDNRSLYFSSMGHQSIGGYDLFVSKINDDGNFEKPENIGFPVNTTDDDIFFVTTPDEKHAYYSSAKEGNIGETDIYRITFEEKVETEVTVLIGKVINRDGGPLSPNIEIIVNDALGKQVSQYYRPNVKTGKYIFSLIAGSTYEILYLVDGVEFDKEILDVPEGTGYQIINREVYLKTVGYGKEHIEKAKLAQLQNASIDTTGAEIKVSGMSTSAMALVNHLKVNIDSVAAGSGQLATTNTTTETNAVNQTESKTNGKTSVSTNSTTNNTTQNAGTVNSTANKPSTKIKASHFLFGFNQSTLSEAALRDLRKLAKIMKKNPNLTLQIEGHTDSAGSDKYNQALSARRAKSVKNYLVSLGVPVARIKSTGIGEVKPIAINTSANGVMNKKGMVYNRRIDLILNERQEEFIDPIVVPDELKIKTESDNTIKTKF